MPKYMLLIYRPNEATPVDLQFNGPDPPIFFKIEIIILSCLRGQPTHFYLNIVIKIVIIQCSLLE